MKLASLFSRTTPAPVRAVPTAPQTQPKQVVEGLSRFPIPTAELDKIHQQILDEQTNKIHPAPRPAVQAVA